MRFVFALILFFRAAPFLAAQPDSSDPHDQISYSSRYFNLYAEKTSFSSFYSYIFNNNISYTSVFENFELAGNIGSNIFRAVSSNSKNNSNQKFINEENYLSLKVKSGFRSFYLVPEIQLSGGHGKLLTGYKISYGFRNSALPIYFSDFSYSKTYIPFSAGGSYMGEGFTVENKNPYYLISTSFGINIRPGLNDVELNYTKNLQIENSFDSAYGYIDKPEIEFFKIDYNHRKKSFRLTGSFSRLNAKQKIFLLCDNLPFSVITIPTISYSNFSIKFELKDYLTQPEFSFDYYWLKIFGVGNMQAWPFTSVVTSIIANRLNFRVNGEISAFNVGSKVKLGSGNFSFVPGIQLYHLTPQSEIDTWQPEYLVFGVRDYFDSYDEIKYLGLLQISSEIKYKFSAYALQLDLVQFAPVYQKKEIRKKRPPTQIIWVKEQPRVSGGTDIRLTLTMNF